MDGPTPLFINPKWRTFSEKVKQRDNHRCLQCNRGPDEVILQVHHERYIEGKAPWEYALSDCRTLCKGCHARAHNLLEPDRGWTLLDIVDLGSLDGVCERKNCGNQIRYAHLTYHPLAGYRTVGSTCIQHLTREDQLTSSRIVQLYKNISEFVHESEWVEGRTKKGKTYLSTTYRHHAIRIYDGEGHYAYQLVFKEKGVKWHSYDEVVPLPGRGLEQVKELAYVVLKGKLARVGEGRERLREVYRRLVRRLR
jgi:hypothetical protein